MYNFGAWSSLLLTRRKQCLHDTIVVPVHVPFATSFADAGLRQRRQVKSSSPIFLQNPVAPLQQPALRGGAHHSIRHVHAGRNTRRDGAALYMRASHSNAFIEEEQDFPHANAFNASTTHPKEGGLYRKTPGYILLFPRRYCCNPHNHPNIRPRQPTENRLKAIQNLKPTGAVPNSLPHSCLPLPDISHPSPRSPR